MDGESNVHEVDDAKAERETLIENVSTNLRKIKKIVQTGVNGEVLRLPLLLGDWISQSTENSFATTYGSEENKKTVSIDVNSRVAGQSGIWLGSDGLPEQYQMELKPAGEQSDSDTVTVYAVPEYVQVPVYKISLKILQDAVVFTNSFSYELEQYAERRRKKELTEFEVMTVGAMYKHQYPIDETLATPSWDFQEGSEFANSEFFELHRKVIEKSSELDEYAFTILQGKGIRFSKDFFTDGQKKRVTYLVTPIGTDYQIQIEGQESETYQRKFPEKELEQLIAEFFRLGQELLYPTSSGSDKIQ